MLVHWPAVLLPCEMYRSGINRVEYCFVQEELNPFRKSGIYRFLIRICGCMEHVQIVLLDRFDEVDYAFLQFSGRMKKQPAHENIPVISKRL